MRRVMGAVAAAAAVTLTAAAAISPALAATRPAGQHARPAHVTARLTAKQHGKLHAKQPAKGTVADVITSDFQGKGKYVTIVSCSGTVATPPPVHLARLNDPLDVRGAKPTATLLKLLGQPKVYKTVYTCTVTVKIKVPAKKRVVVKKSCKLGPGIGVGPWKSCHRVVLNTGFGGEAGTVASHHPAR